jgi:putative cardiolipin synthase
LDAAPDAFLARLALADMAEKTLDAQYFIWNRDSAGIILMDRLYRAAERGVRVRLLLDDTTSGGKDWVLGALNAHPEHRNTPL